MDASRSFTELGLHSTRSRHSSRSGKALTQNSAITTSGDEIKFNLLMLLPPFRGSSAASYVGITNDEGYIDVDWSMRVIGHERTYAVGDCVNFDGPKMGHMAVRQAEVAATNLSQRSMDVNVPHVMSTK